jgi:S-formylglutathione hydrolase FrmB
MKDGTFPKTVIVAPNGKKSWYIDDYRAKYPFASMLVNEFLPHLDTTYPVSTDRRQRAITGMSMGGFGALRFAMVNPDQFGICISEQAGISTRDQAIDDQYYEKFHKGLYGDKLVGEERVNEHFLNNNPLYIAQNTDPESLQRTRWYLQSADDDFHSLPVAELHAVFHRANVKHEYRVNDGSHGKKNGLGDLEDRLNYLAKWFEEGKSSSESHNANEPGVDNG